jgi:hypothetical protein
MPNPLFCPRECNDNVFCNGLEYCEESTRSCEPGLPALCDDEDECTTDSCDPSFDACVAIEVGFDGDLDGLTECRGDCDDSRGDVYPGSEEVCDRVDQDCDGDIDEGVLSPCNDCRPGCNRVVLPSSGGWAVDDPDTAGVRVDSMGRLVLNATREDSNYAWIANTRFGTVTKMDARTGNQLGEYATALNDGTNNAHPAEDECFTERVGGNCPSRTAVDARGAVYIANRAFFWQGTVTKIAGERDDCVDRDGNGVIETSVDLNGNGVIERFVPGEYQGQDDECILWTRNVGGEGGVPRAIAVAADGTIWVGLHDARRVLQLDPSDGSQLRDISVGGSRRNFNPYGAAIDGRGRLWLTEAASGRILSIDTATGAVGLPRSPDGSRDCIGSYGIAIDGRDRVWLAGFQCPSAFRYDSDGDGWFRVRLPDSGLGRGIVVDNRGYVYMAASHTHISTGIGGWSIGDPITRVTRFRADDGGDMRVYGTPSDPLPGLGTVGVGLDADNQVWLINQESATAVRLNPETGSTREFAVGNQPYTYSDFTGYVFRTFTAPNGSYRQIVEGCSMGLTEWEYLNWRADTPGSSSVELRVRSANTLEELSSTAWTEPYISSPADLTVAPGPVAQRQFMEFELQLVADGVLTPRVTDLTIQYNCPI